MTDRVKTSRQMMVRMTTSMMHQRPSAVVLSWILAGGWKKQPAEKAQAGFIRPTIA
jgi:hypothetical protein